MRAAVPGLLLAIAVSVLAWAGERTIVAVAGRALLEAIVLAILIGAVVRALFVRTPARFAPFSRGSAVASGLLLELSIVLLGAGSDL
ncbi:MAG: putative sulfate exporter family transporter, partial [Gemmatimonadaceae bacterium]